MHKVNKESWKKNGVESEKMTVNARNDTTDTNRKIL